VTRLFDVRAALVAEHRDAVGGLFWAERARNRVAVLLVVGEQDAVAAQARRLLTGVGVQVLPARHSLLALFDVKAALSAMVDEDAAAAAALNAFGVDERRNLVDVTVQPGADAVADALRERFGDAVEISWGGPATAV
jgi:hypothetical protein